MNLELEQRLPPSPTDCGCWGNSLSRMSWFINRRSIQKRQREEEELHQLWRHRRELESMLEQKKAELKKINKKGARQRKLEKERKQREREEKLKRAQWNQWTMERQELMKLREWKTQLQLKELRALEREVARLQWECWREARKEEELKQELMKMKVKMFENEESLKVELEMMKAKVRAEGERLRQLCLLGGKERTRDAVDRRLEGEEEDLLKERLAQAEERREEQRKAKRCERDREREEALKRELAGLQIRMVHEAKCREKDQPVERRRREEMERRDGRFKALEQKLSSLKLQMEVEEKIAKEREVAMLEEAAERKRGHERREMARWKQKEQELRGRLRQAETEKEQQKELAREREKRWREAKEQLREKERKMLEEGEQAARRMEEKWKEMMEKREEEWHRRCREVARIREEEMRAEKGMERGIFKEREKLKRKREKQRDEWRQMEMEEKLKAELEDLEKTEWRREEREEEKERRTVEKVGEFQEMQKRTVGETEDNLKEVEREKRRVEETERKRKKKLRRIQIKLGRQKEMEERKQEMEMEERRKQMERELDERQKEMEREMEERKRELEKEERKKEMEKRTVGETEDNLEEVEREKRRVEDTERKRKKKLRRLQIKLGKQMEERTKEDEKNEVAEEREDAIFKEMERKVKKKQRQEVENGLERMLQDRTNVERQMAEEGKSSQVTKEAKGIKWDLTCCKNMETVSITLKEDVEVDGETAGQKKAAMSVIEDIVEALNGEKEREAQGNVKMGQKKEQSEEEQHDKRELDVQKLNEARRKHMEREKQRKRDWMKRVFAPGYSLFQSEQSDKCRGRGAARSNLRDDTQEAKPQEQEMFQSSCWPTSPNGEGLHISVQPLKPQSPNPAEEPKSSTTSLFDFSTDSSTEVRVKAESSSVAEEPSPRPQGSCEPEEQEQSQAGSPVAGCTTMEKKEEPSHGSRNAEGDGANTPREFMFQPAPPGITVRCRVLRDKKKMGNSLYPAYLLYDERQDGKAVLQLAARKQKMTKTSTYVITQSCKEDVVGKLCSNMMGTKFTVCVNGIAPKKPCGASPEKNSMQQELATICYGRTRGPNKMSVVIPGLNDDLQRVPVHHVNDQGSLLKRRQKREMGNLIELCSKTAEWNRKQASHLLDFNGRVTVPSEKNFQLIHPSSPDFIVVQFGRVKEDEFSLDYAFPVCAVQAFAIALSTFVRKITIT